jgi:hypothetical protein
MTDKTKEDFLEELDYDLLSEVIYFDKDGKDKKTKKLTLIAVKIEEGEQVVKALTSNDSTKECLEILINKGYIVPTENRDGKVLASSFHYKTGLKLFTKYSENFFWN